MAKLRSVCGVTLNFSLRHQRAVRGTRTHTQRERAKEDTPSFTTMASDPSPPDGAAAGHQPQQMHTTYEFAVPFRDANRSPARQAPSHHSGSPSQSVSGSGSGSSSGSSSAASSPSASPQQPPAAPVPASQPGAGIHIPKIQPLAGPSPADLAAGLEGKFVDEFGNILDWTGTVLGRVDGDLPSMVGRPVEPTGEILDLDGEVAGYVSENYSRPSLKPLGGNLKTDDEGNIYDDQGNVVGRMHGVSNKGESWNHDKSNEQQQQQHSSSGGQGNSSQPPNCSCGARRPAAPSAPRPDEMYLDVKSTWDGIQLIIKIPTVFNGGGDVRPAAADKEKR